MCEKEYEQIVRTPFVFRQVEPALWKAPFGVLRENYDKKLWILAMRGFSLRLTSKLTRLIGKRANQILARGKEADRRCLLHQNKKDTDLVSCG